MFFLNIFLYLNQWNLIKSQEKEFTEHNKKQQQNTVKVRHNEMIVLFHAFQITLFKCIFPPKISKQVESTKKTLNMNRKCFAFDILCG